MLINFKVKTLDAQTHDFSVDNEMTVREFKDKLAERTSIAAEQQRIIFCGRVLPDERQLKDYDIDGKVVHVAERPPPSQRGAPAAAGSADRSTVRDRPAMRRMRDSPLFRALDGMVVGTMAIPVNGGNSQVPLHTFPSSSTFCVNRITVARHMLNCANNIAAYLENPERGLNNASLDILARGRWTMESTVVEVGITAADLPQNENIVEMVQGAVSAALRHNGNTNVTVLQLPTVFGSNEGAGNNAQSASVSIANNATVNDGNSATLIIEDIMDSEDESGASGGSGTGAGAGTSASTNATDGGNPSTSISAAGPQTEDPTQSSTESTPGNANGNASPEATGEMRNNGTNAGRRTGTPVLADVIDQMRTVQTRLNPFIEQFYSLLRNEPTFAENDTVGRENAQRLYDRVSEAFHYLSHAQHAISDLMLDISLPTPRYLTCRPILVEQSGYVSSNNYLSAAAAAAAAAAAIRTQPPNPRRPAHRPYNLRYQQQAELLTQNLTTSGSTQNTSNRASANANANATPNAGTNSNAKPSGSANANAKPSGSVNANANATVTSNGNSSGNSNGSANAIASGNAMANASENASANASGNARANTTGTVEDPIDDPIIPTNAMNAESATQAGGGPHVDNHQLQMARLIQAVVNSAPTDSEFHVQINAPGIMSFGIPVNAAVAGSASGSVPRIINNTPEQSPRATSDSAGNTGSSSSTVSPPTTSGTPAATPVEAVSNQARVTTATLPTTSTQTRSTARPQVQMGNLPPNNWNGRYMPSNILSAFDRFLPCNSHHIREPEANATASVSTNTNATPGQNLATNVNHRTVRNRISDMMHRDRNQQSTVRPPITMSRLSNPDYTPAEYAHLRNMFAHPTPSGRAGNDPSGLVVTIHNDSLRRQMITFLTDSVFERGPINDETIPHAVERAVRWFATTLIYLPQYEKTQYNARDSIFNLLRRMIPTFIELLNDRQNNAFEFEDQLKELCEQFMKRLYGVLHVCLGRDNAEVYWMQFIRLLLTPVRTVFRSEALEFLLEYINTTIPTNVDTVDAEQFVVHRIVIESPEPTEAGGPDDDDDEDIDDTPPMAREEIFISSPSPPLLYEMQTMDAEDDIIMAEVPSTSELLNSVNPIEVDAVEKKDDEAEAVEVEVEDPKPADPMPTVTNGSESWHCNFPNEWLPVISRDTQTQEEDPPTQNPYSDVYISGMSAKRRKIIQNNKPPSDVGGLLADSVQRAIQAVGVTTSTASNESQSAEEITSAISNDTAVQASYTEALRSNVRERLKNDPDYEADKFPQTTKFAHK